MRIEPTSSASESAHEALRSASDDAAHKALPRSACGSVCVCLRTGFLGVLVHRIGRLSYRGLRRFGQFLFTLNGRFVVLVPLLVIRLGDAFFLVREIVRNFCCRGCFHRFRDATLDARIGGIFDAGFLTDCCSDILCACRSGVNDLRIVRSQFRRRKTLL